VRIFFLETVSITAVRLLHSAAGRQQPAGLMRAAAPQVGDAVLLLKLHAAARMLLLDTVDPAVDPAAADAVAARAANPRGPSRGSHRTPWHLAEDPLDPLQIGKVP
jgi:hypothetical protein